MNRRRLLGVTGSALAVSIAGCLSAIDGTGDPQGTEDLPIRLWFEQVSLSAAERESVAPIVFGDLSSDEQGIVQTSLEEGEYTAEHGSEPQALETLRDRIEQKTGDGETLEAYLRRQETYYRVGFADGDHIIAHPDH